MSARSMLERLRWRVQAEDHSELARLTGLSVAQVRAILIGLADVRLKTLAKIAEVSETPIGMLAEWWAEPEHVGLEAAARSAALG